MNTNELDSKLEDMVNDFIYYAKHRNRNSNSNYSQSYDKLKAQLNQLKAADVLNVLIERSWLV